MRIRTLAAALAGVAALAACSKSSPAAPPADTCTGATVTVPANQVATVPASSAWCVSLPADGSTYLVTPNLAASSGASTTVGVEVGSGPPAAMDVLPELAGGVAPSLPSVTAVRPVGLREQFDYMLREKERRFTPAMRAGAQAQARAAAVVAPPTLGSTRIFNVLKSLSGGYTKDTGVVKYVGTKIVIYQSQNPPPGGWTDGDITALARPSTPISIPSTSTPSGRRPTSTTTAS